MNVRPTEDIRDYLNLHVGKYVNKSKGLEIFLAEIKAKYGLKHILKHDLGENSDGPSPRVIAEFKQLAQNSSILSEYPDSSYSMIRKELAKFYRVEFDNISIGTGSSEIIERIYRAWVERGDKIVLPVPSFYKIEDIALEFGGIPVCVQLREDDDFQWTENTTDELITAVQDTKPKLVWLVTPNNPTGGVIPLEETEKIVRRNESTIVVVDEAYGEYVDSSELPSSAVRLVEQGLKNVLVLRTFSKAYGLGGLRLGYCIGPRDLIRIVERIRLEFPVSAIAEKLAVIALHDQDYITTSVRRTFQNRLLVEESLSTIRNLKYFQSHTNTLLIKHKHKNLYQALLKDGILLARMEITGLQGKNYARMTVKDVEQNNMVVAAISNLGQSVKSAEGP